jgi:signal transduction histidine kinase
MIPKSTSAIAKSVVELHGGKIWLESEVGKGTTVIFTLLAKMEKVKQSEINCFSSI